MSESDKPGLNSSKNIFLGVTSPMNIALDNSKLKSQYSQNFSNKPQTGKKKRHRVTKSDPLEDELRSSGC